MIESVILEKRPQLMAFISKKSSGQYQVSRIKGGRNNQAYRIRDDKFDFLVKLFFEGDDRQRFKRELEFYLYLDEKNVSGVPQLLSYDKGERWLALEFVEGDVVRNIDQKSILAALDFIVKINKSKVDESKLLMASDACTSIGDHILCVKKRLDCFLGSDVSIPDNVKVFVENELYENFKEQLSLLENEFGEQLSTQRQPLIVSPSDFGFQNCLNKKTSGFYFYDFEYAGIDDPAKLVCDFFSQPDVIVPMCFFNNFTVRLSDALDLGGEFSRTCEYLLSLHRIKWCCIMLNEYLIVGTARREFNNPNIRIETARERQFLKVKEYYNNYFNK